MVGVAVKITARMRRMLDWMDSFMVGFQFVESRVMECVGLQGVTTAGGGGSLALLEFN